MERLGKTSSVDGLKILPSKTGNCRELKFGEHGVKIAWIFDIYILSRENQVAFLKLQDAYLVRNSGKIFCLACIGR